MTMALTRRDMLLAAATLPLAAPRALAAEPRLSLRTLPTRIYRSVFNPRERLEGWVFFLIVEAREEEPLRPVALRIIYQAGAKDVREESLTGEAAAAIARQDIAPSRATGLPPTPPAYWPQVFRIHAYVPSEPAIDSTLLKVRLADGRGRQHELEKRIPILDYRQRVSLIFPFRGPGIISQAGVLNGGHRNRSGGFAVDALGLDPSYAPMARPGSDRPQDYAGWARPVIAPAGGLIVHARNDRPDQPKDGESDPAYYAPEFPNGGDVGNHVVIDHGQSEFSLIAHLRSGSVRVQAGDRVTQGQPLGELGNSGDSSGPHLHYQLQDGPNWQYADGLPMRFGNVSSLSRGSYFDAQ